MTKYPIRRIVKEMNGLESTNILFKWFSSNDTFLLERDFKKIVPLSENEEEDRAVVMCGLKDLSEKNIISNIDYHDKEYWILKKPFQAYTQDVEVSPTTALGVEAIINSFCEVLENKEDICDASSISDKDLANMVFICNSIVQNKSEENNSVD